VAAADGRHLDDLALDQLDAVVGSQDADLGHPIVSRPREAPSRRHHLHGHRHPPGSSIAQHMAGAAFKAIGTARFDLTERKTNERATTSTAMPFLPAARPAPARRPGAPIVRPASAVRLAIAAARRARVPAASGVRRGWLGSTWRIGNWTSMDPCRRANLRVLHSCREDT
jgi:hypothetical protein